MALHDARLGQLKSTNPERKHFSLFLTVQTCKLDGIDLFIEQFCDIFYTTLREYLRILGKNIVILVVFYKKRHY